ncbi:MAG: mechanosensitive ion channel [Desulfobulbus sp.]|nr:mechanosensitive ion channel [Desulfobulbus sp.]
MRARFVFNSTSLDRLPMLPLRAQRFSWCSFLTMVLLVLFSLQAGLAADTGKPGGQLQITPEILKAKIDALSQNNQMDEANKTKLLELYRNGLDNLSGVESNNAQANAFIATIGTAPGEIKKLRQALERNTSREKVDDQHPPVVEDDPRPLKVLEQELFTVKASATEIEAQVATLTRQSNQLNDRPTKINQRLSEIKASEDTLNTALKVPPQTTDSPELIEVQGMAAQIQLAALQSESHMLNQEMVSMPVRSELLNLQRDEAASRLDLARQQMQALEAKVNRKRQEEASQSVGEAKEVVAQMADNQPVLQQVAQGNAAYSEQLLAITAALKSTVAARDDLEKELKKIEESYTSTKQKIEMAGLNQALGLLLHDMQRNLPSARQLTRKLTRNRQVIAETGLVQVQTEEERKKQDDIEGDIKELIGEASPDTAKILRPELRSLLASRADLLDKIIAANRIYLGQLSEIELLYTNMLTTVDDFNHFLEERLLWMRSTPVLQWRDLAQLPGEIHALLAPGQWIGTGRALVQQAFFSPEFLLACLIALLVLGGRRSLNRQLETAVNLAGNPVSYHFGLPLKALGLTVLLALPCPLFLVAVGWQLYSLGETNDFSRSVGIALLFLSLRFFYLRIIVVFLRPIGVATRVFFWPKENVTLLRRETSRFLLTFLPVVFFTHIAFYVNYKAGSSHTLGRLSILLILAVIMSLAVRLLHPGAGLWSEVRKNNPQNLLVRLCPLLFVTALAIPLILAVLVIAGYIFAVGGLLSCLINSIWLSFALVVGHQLLEHWLIQSERQLALKKSWNRSAKEVIEEGVGSVARGPESEAMPESKESLADLSMESRKLLNALVTLTGLVGLWLVWFDVLPALRVLNRYTLWTNVLQVNGQALTLPVTVADAGMTLLIGCLTLVATRHLPSLLKIILLKRLQISTGSRYTIVTLTRYCIGAAGILYIADMLGFRWAQIQWLVAALGVGIGFGLQEIVANFISGIIILFERPIRVGDVVTVDTTDGVVTRIRIRATTIRDFDGKELLVPNKEFISGRLLNWSLSDPILRILLPVGVAYGSDVAKAMQLMRQAAENHPLVLKDPKPMVTFDSFGDNALLLNLRCFIGSVDDRVRVRSNLHLAIDEAFRTAGISMAFPQRDVHLDTTTPLAVHLMRREEKEETASEG